MLIWHFPFESNFVIVTISSVLNDFHPSCSYNLHVYRQLSTLQICLSSLISWFLISSVQLLVSYEIYSAEYLLSNPISFLQRSLHLLQHNNWPSKMRKTSYAIQKWSYSTSACTSHWETCLENNNYKNNL